MAATTTLHNVILSDCTKDEFDLLYVWRLKNHENTLSKCLILYTNMKHGIIVRNVVWNTMYWSSKVCTTYNIFSVYKIASWFLCFPLLSDYKLNRKSWSYNHNLWLYSNFIEFTCTCLKLSVNKKSIYWSSRDLVYKFNWYLSYDPNPVYPQCSRDLKTTHQYLPP